VIVRRSSQSEWPAIEAFYREFHESRTQLLDGRLWHWQFVEKPGVSDENFPFFVIEDNGAICGTIGGNPLQVQVDGRQYSACHPVNFFVAPGYAGLPALRLRGMLLANYEIVIAANISSDTDRLSRASRYTDFSDRLLSHSYTVGLGTASKSASLLDSLETRITLVLRTTWTLLNKIVLDLIQGNVEVRKSKSIDKTYLSELDYSQSINGICKNSDYLIWRFAKSPLLNCEYYSACEGDLPYAIAVVHFTDAGDAVILDVIGASSESLVLRKLLISIIRDCRQSGIRLLRSTCMNTAMQRQLVWLGFTSNASSLGLMVHSGDEVLNAALADVENWQLTIGDTDFY